MLTESFIKNNFPKGKLTLVGGCPAMGKTTFAISLAISLARQNKKCFYFSCEIDEEELVRRIKLQTGKSGYNEVKHKIDIDDAEIINLSHIRKQIEGNFPDYVIVDYIQLMRGEYSMTDRYGEMHSILNGLKKMAKDLDISVIALSQLNRGLWTEENYDLSTNNFRELSKTDLYDVKLACIHRGEYFKQYEYDCKGERIEGLIKYVSFQETGYNITNLILNHETIEISMYLPRKKLLYIHGLSSSGMSETAYTLRRLLPEYEILSPDLPVNPQEAYEMLKDICKQKNPELIVGTSMGGMFAQLLKGYKKILVNPAFHVSEFMRTIIGRQEFLNPRRDGETYFEITSELCDAYQQLESCQFDGILDFDIKNTYALFGTRDKLVHGYNEYKSVYVNAEWFDGEHRLNEEIIKTVVIPLIRKNALQSSPLFNLSLSSKELFHSNFLGWLAQQYPEFFVEICKDLGCKAGWSNTYWIVKREYMNFDLCIEADGDIVLVLENKVKSIPSKSQLDEYVDKLNKKEKQDNENRDLVLLSLSISFPDKQAIENAMKWQIRSYEDLWQAIVKNKHNFIHNLYENDLIEDYCLFIATLHELSKSWKVENTSRFLIPENEKRTFKDLRIADLQDKVWYSQLLERLNSCLKEDNRWDNIISGMNIEDIGRDESKCLCEVFTNCGFTHGQGLLEAKIKINKEYVLLIQIQGNRYCHGIEWIKKGNWNYNQLWEMTKEEGGINNLSFFQFAIDKPAHFPNICKDIEEPIITRRRKDEIRNFNKYGDRFLYQSKQIKEEVLVPEVLNAIKKELGLIVDSFRNI